jgi:anti-sigma-K factor RskA
MITELQEERASLYALGLLDGPEKAGFESEVATNPALGTLVSEFTESSAALALIAPSLPPPAALKERVLAQATTARVTRFPFAAALPWAAAAGFALVAAWLTSQNFALRRQNQGLQTEHELAQIAYQTAQAQLGERSLVAEKMISELGNKLRQSEDLARLKISALASLAGNTKEAQVIAVWDPAQQAGLLTIEKLPAIAATQDYQIWIVDPAYPNPVNGGVFNLGTDGKVSLPFKPDQPVAQVAAFAISLEKKGGVPKAEGPIVLLGK